MANKPEIKSIVFDPLTASNLAVNMVNSLRNEQGIGIKSGLADLDKEMLPFRPGELITVMGYTSHYKSGFMNWLSKQALKAIPDESNEIVVRVTWEQSVEEDTLSWLAGKADLSVTKLARGMVDEAEWKRLDKAGNMRAATPMWIMGHSQTESTQLRKARPRMTMRDVALAIEYILHDATPNQLKLKMVVLDYLQRMRPDPQDGNTKREQMMEAVNQSKDLAIAYGAPVVLGVQTGRDILDRVDKMPRLDDGQETSNIEQSSDKMFGLWYPIKTEKEGEIVGKFPVTKNLLFVSLLKQKLGPAPVFCPLFVNPEKNQLEAMSYQVVKP
jgi:replicative DNA helicase